MLLTSGAFVALVEVATAVAGEGTLRGMQVEYGEFSAKARASLISVGDGCSIIRLQIHCTSQISDPLFTT